MFLSNYQKTELVLGTLLFSFFYFLYLKISSSKIIIWDILWCTFTIFIAFLFKFFYIKYNLIQSQNFILT
jgi:hypothetical protein